ncbi:uncharacterized protein J3R85_002939 [Psidium guajava]|nr:uncharacterized protein J3R85_002939 [Psidium guajava]
MPPSAKDGHVRGSLFGGLLGAASHCSSYSIRTSLHYLARAQARAGALEQ